MIREYELILAHTIKDLNDRVNELIREGFEFLCPLKVYDRDNRFEFLQEMAKVDRKFNMPPNDVNQREWGRVE